MRKSSFRHRGRRGGGNRPRWNKTVDTVIEELSYGYATWDGIAGDHGPTLVSVGQAPDIAVAAPITWVPLVAAWNRQYIGNPSQDVDFGGTGSQTAGLITAIAAHQPHFKRSYYGTYGVLNYVRDRGAVSPQIPLSFGFHIFIIKVPNVSFGTQDPYHGLQGTSQFDAEEGIQLDTWSQMAAGGADFLYSRKVYAYYGDWIDQTLGATPILPANRLLTIPINCRRKVKLAESEGIYLGIQPAGVGQGELFADQRGGTSLFWPMLKSRVALFS